MTRATDFSGWRLVPVSVFEALQVFVNARMSAPLPGWEDRCEEAEHEIFKAGSNMSSHPAAESVAALVKMLRTVRVGIEMGRIEDQNLRDPISAKATEITYTALSKLIDAALAPFGEG